MKKVIKPVRVFVSMLLMGCAISFSACSDNENTPQVPDEVTTDAMFGDYTGKVVMSSVNPLEGEDTGEGEETPAGTDVSASVANDTISFTNFPIKDIVLSVVGDEALADQIVEAVGDVNYKIGYEPTLTANKDSVVFVMHPESLKLSVTLPSSTEEEAQPLLVEVKVEAGNTAAYAVESGNMKFDFHAAEILLGESEGQTSLPGFKGMSFDFDMNQSKLAHHGF